MWHNCGCSWMFLQKYWSTLFSLTFFLHQFCVNHATCNNSGLLELLRWYFMYFFPVLKRNEATISSNLQSVFTYLVFKAWASFLVFSLGFKYCNNYFILFYFSFLGSSSFSHTWMFIRKQLRFWRFIQKAYYLYVWWRIIRLTLCCKNIWNRTQRKTF